MPKARSSFFVCAGLLCLALAYHLGARSAGAQAGSKLLVVAGWIYGGQLVVAADGSGFSYTSGAWRTLAPVPLEAGDQVVSGRTGRMIATAHGMVFRANADGEWTSYWASLRGAVQTQRSMVRQHKVKDATPTKEAK